VNDGLRRLMALANSGHHSEVEAWARPRAERGDADGQFLLGFLVYAGACIDFATACDWLRRAAEQGHAEALYHLSRIDESETRAHSRSPINDTMRARLRRAAELGSADAQHDLAVLLATGHGGFSKDEVEARILERRAAQTGHLQAQVAFGQMCLLGEGGPVDAAEGLMWLEKVAAIEISSDPWGPLMVSQAAKFLETVYRRGLGGVTVAPEKAAASRARFESARQDRDKARAADDCAVSRDAEGRKITRAFAFADRAEAREVLADHMRAQRLRGRGALLGDLNRDVVTRLRGPSRIEYEASVHVFWEDQPDGALSVSGSIEDHGWRTYTTLSEFFSASPDGTIHD
jgi:TPR repeat protein